MLKCTEKALSDNESILNLEQAATQIIRNMGIPANLKGYIYLRTAIVCAVEQPNLTRHFMRQLYEMVAEIHHVKLHSVERAIRYAIEIAYDRNPEQLKSMFYYPVGKPCNSELIALAVDIIRFHSDFQRSSHI